VKAELVRIGNSRGIRIPKPLIEQCRLGDTVDLFIEDDRLVISRQRKPRQGWDAAFRATRPDERLLLDSLPPSKFDREDWKW